MESHTQTWVLKKLGDSKTSDHAKIKDEFKTHNESSVFLHTWYYASCQAIQYRTIASNTPAQI